MQEPELLDSGPDRRVPPAFRKGLLGVVVLALVGAAVVVSLHRGGTHRHTAAADHGAAARTPIARSGPAPPAAPVAADLARVVVDPARHRLRLVFTLFNTETTQVVLVRVGSSGSGLLLHERGVQRFSPGGVWRPAGLPLVLDPAQSGHVALDYRLQRCPPPQRARLHVPAVLTNRERGRVMVDLTALVPPHDWPRGLVTLLCPMSSR